MNPPGIVEKTLLFTAGSSATFYFFSLNRGSWRYASIPDLTAIVKSATVAVIGYVLIQFLYIRGDGLPRAVPIILWLLLVGWLAGPRLLFRLVSEGGGVRHCHRHFAAKSGSTQMLIYGMNDIAEAYIRAVRLRSEKDVFIAGIIDDFEPNRGRILQGKRVLGRAERPGADTPNPAGQRHRGHRARDCRQHAVHP